jgi:hypothetical protein
VKYNCKAARDPLIASRTALRTLGRHQQCQETGNRFDDLAWMLLEKSGS